MTAHPIPRFCSTLGGWCRDAACRVSTAIAHAFCLLFAALREIFDEAAYARFLARTDQPSTRSAYAGFLREHAASQERRPRCC